jgi:hypothetical protein
VNTLHKGYDVIIIIIIIIIIICYNRKEVYIVAESEF